MQDADQILIPLLDGTHALAQVAGTDANQALIYLTARRATPSVEATTLTATDIIAGLVTDTSTLKKGRWPIIGYTAIPRGVDLSGLDADLPNFSPQDPAILESLASAVHGLYPWDGFADPDFFTDMLVDGQTRPTTAKTYVQLNPPRLT